jgi:hypothetical protein
VAAGVGLTAGPLTAPVPVAAQWQLGLRPATLPPSRGGTIAVSRRYTMKHKLPIAVVVAGGLLAGPAHRVVAQEDDAPQPPVEFTACVRPGPRVTEGTEEPTFVSLPDGEMTIVQTRGFTWQLDVTDVSDPRLAGTWYTSWDNDSYTGAGVEPGTTFATFTFRVENPDGAWQGSAMTIGDPQTTGAAPFVIVMIGEGAYESLTAVMAEEPSVDSACPNARGYIIEGSVPAPPVPNTGG